MPKDDKTVDTGVDVQIISGGAGGGSISVPATQQNGNGVMVFPLPQMGTMPAPSSGPAVIVITVGKKEEEKKRQSSSVFQRL
jgi:hypothetical protein